MNVSVPDPVRDWIQSRIESGQYASASDYVLDLIRRDQQASQAKCLSVEDIRRSIEESRATSETHPIGEVFERIEAKIRSTAT